MTRTGSVATLLIVAAAGLRPLDARARQIEPPQTSVETDATAEAQGEEVGTDAGPFPRLEGEVSVEVQNDLTFDADDPDAEVNDLYTTTEGYFKLRFTREFSVETGLVFEPVLDPEPGEDRAFEDQGLFIQQLLARYATDRFELYGGKFNPPFGIAWDAAPGIYGADFAEAYELTERIGLGGALIFGGEGLGGDGFGAHRLSANAFFIDTSGLSQSAFTERGRTELSDGGVGNTEDLSSFSLTLDGADIPGLPGLGYHLGFLHQGASDEPFAFEDEFGTVLLDGEDENGFVAGLTASMPLNDRVTVEGIVEAAYFTDAEGLPQDRFIGTAGAALVLDEKLNLALSAALRDTDADSGLLASTTDRLFQVSAGYRFDFGLGVDVGYRFAEEDELDASGLGVLLSWSREFAVP